MKRVFLWVDATLRRSSATLTWLMFILAAIVGGAGWFLEGRARLAPELAPQAWVQQASAQDIMQVPDYQVAYWGKPDARYGYVATKRKAKPVAIVVHFTTAKPVLNLVSYGHRRDFSRSNGSYGYHFYVGRGGGIAQGAPLGKRTNHIKSQRRPQRTKTARHLWSGNTIGISLVGGCDWLLRPDLRRWTPCSGEYVTERQFEAGAALVRAIQSRFGMACAEIYGHGELQTDRRSFEGLMLARQIRESCSDKVADSR